MAKKNLKMAVEGVVTAAPEASIARRSKEDEARERKWKAEDALRDIERAEGHKKNKELMRDVKQCAKEKMQTMGKVVAGK
jgi:predicted metal-dependent hydrolase